MKTNNSDMKECLVWVHYSDNAEINVEAVLDLDRSIEEQVYELYGRSPEDPEIVGFSWQIIDNNKTSSSELYSQSDWAELFALCARYSETASADHYHAITTWLVEYSKTHDLPLPEDTSEWSDTRYTIKEALSFLDKFAENWNSELESRK